LTETNNDPADGPAFPASENAAQLESQTHVDSIAPDPASGAAPPQKYRMRISRTTIDKLGIKLYDRVAAVLAELVANAYDADAEIVEVDLPFNTLLASKSGEQITDLGYNITVHDDGIGMTAQEVNDHYLRVGIDRRSRGDLSREKQRRVMGRKGIGKLAPFGICHVIRVTSAGGDPVEGKYGVVDLELRVDAILQDEDDDYFPTPASLDGTTANARGTTITLTVFDHRRVPDAESLNRQLSARFGLEQPDWRVEVRDSNSAERFTLGQLGIPLLEPTRGDLSARPVALPDGGTLPVSGWIGYARDPYKDDAMAGVRIFARGKLVAQTRDFDISAGFTGEFKLRSYLVGEVHAEWLDEAEDLVRSDRQDILWNSERGEALKDWGQQIVRELARSAESSVRVRVWEEFVENATLSERLERAIPDDAVLRDSIKAAAKLLVGGADRETVRDRDYIERIMGLAFSIGPHRQLLESLRDAAEGSVGTLATLSELFRRASLSEMYSLGQVAQERLDAVNKLRQLIGTAETPERDLQELLERAPWILNPTWTPLSRNQSLKRVRTLFESWYGKKYGEPITTSAIENPTKRPDFILLNDEGILEIVEIKKPAYGLTADEMRRAYSYLEAMRGFLSEVQTGFQRARLTIVCDSLNFDDPLATGALEGPDVEQIPWERVLDGTMRAHEDFLEVVKELEGARALLAATDPGDNEAPPEPQTEFTAPADDG
jgi:hypothetical protein